MRYLLIAISAAILLAMFAAVECFAPSSGGGGGSGTLNYNNLYNTPVLGPSTNTLGLFTAPVAGQFLIPNGNYDPNWNMPQMVASSLSQAANGNLWFVNQLGGNGVNLTNLYAFDMISSNGSPGQVLTYTATGTPPTWQAGGSVYEARIVLAAYAGNTAPAAGVTWFTPETALATPSGSNLGRMNNGWKGYVVSMNVSFYCGGTVPTATANLDMYVKTNSVVPVKLGTYLVSYATATSYNGTNITVASPPFIDATYTNQFSWAWSNATAATPWASALMGQQWVISITISNNSPVLF